LGKRKSESRNPQGGQHSPTWPGGCKFRKSTLRPGVISKGGNQKREAARFLTEGNREEKIGETLVE